MGLKERREREREERRQQILVAARTLLSKKGLGGTSIQQIAKNAELGVGTIYFYYRSKEELFAALQQEGLEVLQDQVKAAGGRGKTPADRLTRIALAYLRFSEEHKDYFDIINYFIASPEEIFTPELKIQVDQKGNRVLEQVEEVIREGIRVGAFKKVHTRRISIMLWGTMHGLIQFKKMENTVLQGEDHATVYKDSVEHMIQSLIA
jgi:AcrR family transcriptional regulator